MPSGCCDHCQGLENIFDKQEAEADLASYRRDGPSSQTQLLLKVLREAGVDGLTLLDIGGGIGAIQHELLTSGVRSAVNVDASSAYQSAAQEEAARRGTADRVQYLHGDFVDLADQVERTDIVTLDRVICCYPDMPTLVGLSAAHAGKFYALVFPRDSWWMKVAQYGENIWWRIQRNSFRFFIHSSEAVDKIIRANGFEPRFKKNAGLIWQVVVYART